MSSEMYVRWNVQNLERMHRQLKIRLEQERKQQAELFQQMNENIKTITEKINSAKSTAASVQKTPLIRAEKVSNINDYDTDEIISTGFSENIENVNVEANNSKKRNLSVSDWSNYLDAFELETSDKAKKFAYAQEIDTQLTAVSTESKDDIMARNDFVSYLNELLNDDGLDYEYFRELVQRRFDMLKKVSERYTEKNKEDYVYQNLVEVFEELDMRVVEEMELDGLPGHKVVDKDLPDCSIFMSMDGGGIIFETVAEVDNSEALSYDKKAMIEESAHKVCQKHLMVIRKMQERGILLQVECEEKPNAEKMRKIVRNNSRRMLKGKKQEQYIGG